jgi:hypothetical protein
VHFLELSHVFFLRLFDPATRRHFGAIVSSSSCNFFLPFTPLLCRDEAHACRP